MVSLLLLPLPPPPLQGAVCRRRRRVAQKPAAAAPLYCGVTASRGLSIEWLLTRPLLFPNARGINFSKLSKRRTLKRHLATVKSFEAVIV